MCDWHYQGSNFLYIYIYIYMWCGEMVYDYRWNKVGMIITPARIILATMQVKKKKNHLMNGLPRMGGSIPFWKLSQLKGFFPKEELSKLNYFLKVFLLSTLIISHYLEDYFLLMNYCVSQLIVGFLA